MGKFNKTCVLGSVLALLILMPSLSAYAADSPVDKPYVTLAKKFYSSEKVSRFIFYWTASYVEMPDGTISSADGYEIEYSKDNFKTVRRRTARAKARSVTLTFKKFNTRKKFRKLDAYKARIRAFKNINGVMKYSGWRRADKTVNFTNHFPLKIRSAEVSDNDVILSWNASPDRSVKIYRRTADTPWVRIASLTDLDNQYTDKSVEYETDYKYTILASREKTAVKRLDKEKYNPSQKIHDTSLAFPVRAPLIISEPFLKTAEIRGGVMTATWDASQHAELYVLEYADNENFKNAKKVKVKTTSAKIKDMPADVTYYVRVRGRTILNGKKYFSEYSNTLMCFYKKDTKPEPVTMDVKTLNSTTCIVTWQKNDSDGYEVQYSKNFLFIGATKKTTTGSSMKLTVSPASTVHVRVRAYNIINGKKSYSKYTVKRTTTTSMTIPVTPMTSEKYAYNFRKYAKALAGYVVPQGACTDGKYMYILFQKINGDSLGTKNKAVIKIAKVTTKAVDGYKAWQIIKVSGAMKCGHANACCYNPKDNKIYITRAAAGGDRKVCLVDASLNSTKVTTKTVNVSGIRGFNDISYDAKTDTFFFRTRSSGGKTFIMSGDLKKVIKQGKVCAGNQGGTTSGKQHKYLFYSSSGQIGKSRQTNKNYIYMYNYETKKLLQKYRLNTTGEIENVVIVGNKMYATIHRHVKIGRKVKGMPIIYRIDL